MSPFQSDLKRTKELSFHCFCHLTPFFCSSQRRTFQCKRLFTSTSDSWTVLRSALTSGVSVWAIDYRRFTQITRSLSVCESVILFCVCVCVTLLIATTDRWRHCLTQQLESLPITCMKPARYVAF